MHDHNYKRRHMAALPLAWLAGSALAQSPPTPPVPPDAGALRQQIERDQGVLLPRAATPPKPAQPPALKPGAASIDVRSFHFAGNTLLSAEQLAPAVAPYLGRRLSFAELQAAAAAVAQAYRDAGWVVRAYLPQQDVSSGIVTVQIVEAVFGGTTLEGAEPTRLKLSLVLGLFDQQQKQGAPLNAEALDRALLLADDLPGVAVVGALQEGQQSGQTDLVLKMTDEPLLLGEVVLDNTGSRATGDLRATVTANFNSPFGLGDLFTAQLLHSQGSDYLRLGGSLPVGSDGLRVGLNASTMNYRVITDEFKALNPKGSSESLGLDATYSLIRSRQRNLYLLANLDQKQFRNESSNAVQSDYRVNTVTVGLSGNLFDSVGGGGANAASLSYLSGRVDQGTRDANENAALDGRFGKWRASLSRQQVLTSELTLFASLATQHAPKPLDSSEKFFLGGNSGVRAYPSSEGGGSSGDLATLELRSRLMASLNLTVFYDWGTVRNYDGTPSYSLAGAGLGVAWTPAWGGNLRATWAHRLGDNPNPSASGNDQDGSLDKNRWWLMATLPF